MESLPNSPAAPSIAEDPALGLSHRAKMEILFAVPAANDPRGRRSSTGSIAPVPMTPATFSPRLQVPGTVGAPFEAVLTVDELPPGAMRRVSQGDLDLLLVHTDRGVFATDDRCPHMSAPLSIGVLEGCIVQCPLHEGRFDLASGDPVQMPTTGGLDPDGVSHPTWSPAGREPKVDPPGTKAQARRLTRVRRFRYYPVRIVDDRIEVALPV